MKRLMSLLIIALLFFGFYSYLPAQDIRIIEPELVIEEVPSQSAMELADLDLNMDGLLTSLSQKEIQFVNNAKTPPTPGLIIAMIQTGSWSDPYNRLLDLGYSVTTIPPTSGLSTFRQYDIVYLPVSWAEQGGDYEEIESHAADYQAYVKSGGGLFIDQPNPFQQPSETVTPTLLPYPITFYNDYDTTDWPPVIVDPTHEITQGLSEDEMPFPADQMVSVDPHYYGLENQKREKSSRFSIFIQPLKTLV